MSIKQPPGGARTLNLFGWDEGQDKEKTPSNPARSQGPGNGSASLASQLRSQIFSGENSSLSPQSKGGRQGSTRKQEEMSGSGIFSPRPVTTSSNAYANNNDQNCGNYITNRPSVRLHQPAGGASQVFLGGEPVEGMKLKTLSPLKKAELSGSTPESSGEGDSQVRRQFSAAKMRELNGSISIFSPPAAPSPNRPQPDHQQPNAGEGDSSPARLARQPSAGGSPVTANLTNFGEEGEAALSLPVRRVSGKKVADLQGTGQYKDVSPTLSVSAAKQRELQGCNIFADGKPQFRESLGGIRQPPGGESSIALI
eukprot:TRINITY_DN10509_c0_g1_i1.p1 TRINITY_DN10509_c0_g1~~TRINITY_DN10509_c0_g1_i1.p1  ORF type:complete len:311 (+),score=58.41 TRINITY_DN10509_c0_g1_i1:207-1139(+)